MGCIVIAYYYVLIHIIYHYYYLEALEQAADVDGPQHGVDIQAATIRGQRRQSQATKVIGVKLVEEVGNFCSGLGPELTPSIQPRFGRALATMTSSYSFRYIMTYYALLCSVYLLTSTHKLVELRMIHHNCSQVQL
jgi:hypothetical protein